MDGVADELLVSAASQMSGVQRRMFLAAVCLKLCDNCPGHLRTGCVMGTPATAGYPSIGCHRLRDEDDSYAQWQPFHTRWF
jgi:hypothetical protein